MEEILKIIYDIKKNKKNKDHLEYNEEDIFYPN